MANVTEILKQLKEERERLDKAITVLSSLNGSSRTGSSRGVGRTTRLLSPAARRKIAAAQRARWARARSGKTQSAPKASRPRVVSAAARRKMAAAQRARWARVRAAQTKKAA